MKYIVRLIVAFFSFLSMFSVCAEVSNFETQRPDGSDIHWSLDVPEGQDKQVGLVVIMQGSGCDSIKKSGSLELTRTVFSDFAALTVEKYGVKENRDVIEGDEQGECPLEYYANNTNSQRVVDYVQILGSLSSAEWWNGQLVLIGGSEGGDIAARVSAQRHPQAVVLISSGGSITFGELVRETNWGEMERNEVPREHWPDVDGIFSRARENPQSAQVEGGYSYKYWADSIDRRTVDDMLNISAPLLLIQGTSDTSVPVYDARAAVDIFTKAKRCNLTYWEKAGYSHRMVDADGTNRMEEVLQEVRFWVKSKLEQSKTSSCSFCERKEDAKIDQWAESEDV